MSSRGCVMKICSSRVALTGAISLLFLSCESPTAIDTSSCGSGRPCSDQPVAVAGGLLFRNLSTGSSHTCGLTAAGEAFCWGSNESGQLGSGTADRFAGRPTRVVGGLSFTSISAGGYHTCAVTAAGSAYCWGLATNDALGTESHLDSCINGACRQSPAPVAGDMAYSSISAGGSHTCALTEDGVANCWGWNPFGEAGNGSFNTQLRAPAPVAGDHRFASLTAGFRFTCALTATGAAYCWGHGDWGQLGTTALEGCNYAGLVSACSTTPTRVEGDVALATITTGVNHTCARTDVGESFCWGENGQGQLGTGSSSGAPTPVRVSTGQPLAVVSAGAFHTCGISVHGQALCWGQNASGELGTGSSGDPIPSPAPLAGGDRGFVAIHAGGGSGTDGHTCALTATGAAYCWGTREYGRLGDE